MVFDNCVSKLETVGIDLIYFHLNLHLQLVAMQTANTNIKTIQYNTKYINVCACVCKM